MNEIMHRSKQRAYSINSSAIASIVGGTVMPSVFAVFRSFANSNLVDCMTGTPPRRSQRSSFPRPDAPIRHLPP
jgi:hypothetical protein